MKDEFQREHLIGIGEAVERLHAEFPDVTISSLRFLEREGLLEPKRTPGGHRLFGEDDLERIRLIKRYQAQHRSLAEIRDLLDQRAHVPTPSDLADRFVREIRAGRGPEAEALIEELGRIGMPYRTICLDVLTPALVRIGDLWATGEVDVGTEHLASATVRDLLASLRHTQPPAPPNGRTAVAVCVAGERHELGLRMVSALLEQEGWRVFFLGADTPAASAVRMVEDAAADLLLVSLGAVEGRPYLVDLLDRLDRSDRARRTAVVVGGRVASAAVNGLHPRVGLVADSAETLFDWLAGGAAVRR